MYGMIVRPKQFMSIVCMALASPLAQGERIKVRGFRPGDVSYFNETLTLPSPCKGRGDRCPAAPSIHPAIATDNTQKLPLKPYAVSVFVDHEHAIRRVIFGARCRREFLPGFRELVAGQSGYWQRASRSWSLKSQPNHESHRVDQWWVGMRP